MPALLEELAPFIAPFLEQELVVELGEPINSGPRFDADAERMLASENVARACARFGEVPDATAIARHMWLRYQGGEA